MTLDQLLDELRAEAARGERGEAYRAFWREVVAELTRFYGRCSVSKTDADSLIQRSALVVVRKIDIYKQTGPNSFRRWLYTIARFELVEWRRKGSLQQRYAGQLRRQPAPTPGFSPAKWLALREELSFVSRYIKKLRTRDREVLAHHDMHALARAQGTSVEVARGRWRRAVGRLQKALRKARTSWRVRIPKHS